MEKQVVNVVVAGLGGQGVLKASDILAQAAFSAGYDVKKSELHGMSQRGGSVTSDVRFGAEVLSPMVPYGDADYLVVLSRDQVEVNQGCLKPGGVLITQDNIDEAALSNKRTINIALLGALSRYLEIPEAEWHAAMEKNLPKKSFDLNLEAFATGRNADMQEKQSR